MTTWDRWIRSKADELAVDAGCYFSLRAAEYVRDFFSTYLCHSKGKWAGQPFELLDWQWEDVIAPLFGWKRRNGTRRYRIAYIELPKKNGKSTLAAAVGVYLLCGDGEQGAEVYSTAVDQKQASIVHGEAVRMVRASKALAGRLSIHETTKTISVPRTNGLYSALSGESANKEGLNASGLIVDELHVWNGRKLWDALKYAGRSRTQPLRFVISTAGDDELSVCYEQHSYAKRVASGEVNDPRYFAYIRAAAVDDDLTSPDVWRKANPSLGQTFDEEEFAADLQEAQKTPTSLANFKRYSFNIWSTGTNPAIRPEDWQKCGGLDVSTLRGRECYGGLDLSKTSDTTALVLAFKLGDRRALLPFFWLPEAAVNDPDAPEEYRLWAAAGLIETTPGNVCDYAFIRRRMKEIAKQYRMIEYRYDPYNAEHVTQEIEEDTGLKRIPYPQTIINYAEPTSEFERLVISGQLHHPSNPVLDWQARNVAFRCDVNNNKRPVKPPHGDKRKIDGIVAAIMAVAGCMQDKGPSVYSKRGIVVL